MDLVTELLRFNQGRDPERLALKFARMAADPLSFLRGSCHLFHARLHVGPPLPEAPPAWACGDLHLQNFGSYKGDNRLAYFDINDFDEAALAPAHWDLLRLLTSVRAWCQGPDAKAADAEAHANALCTRLLRGYATALTLGHVRWIERDTAQGLVRDTLQALRERSRVQWLNRRTVLDARDGSRRLRVDGSRALPASDAQTRQVRRWIADFAKTQTDPKFFKVIDVARRVAGTGSLGLERYVVLVRGKNSPDGQYLLDLKRAQPSSLAPYLSLPQPAWTHEAERVVALQRRMQAVSTAFLHPLRWKDGSYVLRGLQPSEDRVTLSTRLHHGAAIEQLMDDLGRLTAWAQLRSAGRQGSASADELIDWGGQLARWEKPVQRAAKALARHTVADWTVFRRAWAQGAFGSADATG